MPVVPVMTIKIESLDVDGSRASVAAAHNREYAVFSTAPTFPLRSVRRGRRCGRSACDRLSPPASGLHQNPARGRLTSGPKLPLTRDATIGRGCQSTASAEQRTG